MLELSSFNLDSLQLIPILIGLVLGFLINFTGVGGGVLLVPVLNVLFKLEISAAVGTASLISALTKVYSTYQHVRFKTIHYRLSILFLIGSLPGLFLAGGGINYYLLTMPPEKIVEFQGLLKNIIIVVIFVAVLLMIPQQTNFLKRIKEKLHTKSEKMLLIPAGIVIGIIMGATGIGGGVIIFPTFFLLTKIPSKGIVGSSIFITLIISGITSLIYGGGDQLDIPLAINLTIGSFIGIALTNFTVKKASNRFVEYFIMGLILISLVVMIFTK